MNCLPVCRPLLPSADMLTPYLKRIDLSRRYTNHGELTQDLARRLSQHMCGLDDVLRLTSSGTAALLASILAVAGRADKRPLAICPSYSFVATASAVELAGYQPHFVDVDQETWTLCPQSLLKHPLLDQVGLLVVVAPYGKPVDQKGWHTFSTQTGIPVVIDGAASFEALCRDPNKFTGDIPVAISFHATKSFSTGEGGAVVCRDSDVQNRVVSSLNFGFFNSRECCMPNFNGKMSEYHAAVGLAELDGWEDKQRAFAEVAEMYRHKAAAHGLGPKLHTSPEISSNYALFQANDPENASSISEKLTNAGVGFRRWYGTGMCREPNYILCSHDLTPVTAMLGQCLIGLPMAQDMREEDVDLVLGALS